MSEILYIKWHGMLWSFSLSAFSLCVYEYIIPFARWFFGLESTHTLFALKMLHLIILNRRIRKRHSHTHTHTHHTCIYICIKCKFLLLTLRLWHHLNMVYHNSFYGFTQATGRNLPLPPSPHVFISQMAKIHTKK